MKKNTLFFVTCCAIYCFTGCATSSVDKSNNENLTNINENPIEQTVESEIDTGPLFVDWKYKGFGSDLPEWFDSLWNDDLAQVKIYIPDLDQVLVENGDDVDICETLLNQREQENDSLGEAAYSFWVKVNLNNSYFKKRKDFTNSLNGHTYFDYRLYLR